jgi:hypothetical protein
MARFYFSVKRDGALILDDEGDDLPDVEAADALAQDILADMRRLPHIYGEPREWQRDGFVITDEQGAVVLTKPFAEAKGGS